MKKNTTAQQHPRYLALMGLILIVILAGILLSWKWKNPNAFLIFASGQDGGIYVELASEFQKIIEKQLPDIRVELQKSAGSVENVFLIDSETAQLALVQNDIPGSSNLRTVAPLHLDYLHFLVRKGAGISSFRELDGKSFTTGLNGSGSLPVVEALMDYFSISKETTVVSKKGVTEGIEALKAGKTDALLLMLGFRAPAIMELFKSTDNIELVSIPAIEVEALSGFVLSYPICEQIDLPPFAYGDQPQKSIPTLAIQTLLVAHRNVSPQIIKPITEVLFTHRAELIHQHPAAAQMTESFSASSVSFPVHEGARQYFSRDEPGFIIRYAEMMAFLLSVIIACYGLFRATSKWISQRQKDRIDDYYIKVEEYIQDLESEALRESELHEIEKSIREIRHGAFQQLAGEKLVPDSSFRILQHLLDQCEESIRRRRQT